MNMLVVVVNMLVAVKAWEVRIAEVYAVGFGKYVVVLNDVGL
jgi:hypothetical protein